MRLRPPLSSPRSALMGSSGTARRMMVSPSPMVTRILAPAFRPIFLRKAEGMTTCPLAEVFTMGICVHLIAGSLNKPKKV